MVPPAKVNAKQKALLESLIDMFLENQKGGILYKFWPVLYRQWFEKYAITEDTSIENAEERRKDLVAKVEKKKDYLRRWYHNHASPKVRSHAPVPVVAVTFKKPTRRPQLVQLYCKKYYSSRIKPLIVSALNGKTPTKKEFLTLLRIHSAAALEDETPEVKAQMNEEYQKRLSEPVEEPEEEVTPSSYTVAINSIPVQFNAFARELAARTGWSFTLFAGGPDPTNCGRINTATYHSCENMAGLSFADATPNFTSSLVTPFAIFLCTVYTPEDCASRALHSTSQLPQPTQPVSGNDASTEMPHSATSPIIVSTATDTMALTLGGNETDLDNDLWQDFDLEQALAELNQTSTIPITFNGFEGLGPPGQFPSMVDELFAPLPQVAYRPHTPSHVTPSVAAITDATGAPQPFLPPTLGSAATKNAAVNTPAAQPLVLDATSPVTSVGTNNTRSDEGENSNLTSAADGGEEAVASISDGPQKRKHDRRAGEDPDVVVNTKRARKPATSEEAPTTDTSEPQKRKRTCKAGEDPDLIVTTKRVRKPAPSKEIETMVIAGKEKENKRPTA